MMMERRVSRNAHARCESGENLEMTSKDYLLIYRRLAAALSAEMSGCRRQKFQMRRHSEFLLTTFSLFTFHEKRLRIFWKVIVES